MNNLLIKIAQGEKITDDMIAEELYYVCNSVHSSCNSDCPVYSLNGNTIPDTANDFEVNRGCDCFKDGPAMLKFIREH